MEFGWSEEEQAWRSEVQAFLAEHLPPDWEELSKGGPGSDAQALRRTLHEVFLSWPDATRVYPGHGPATTIGRERRSNPFLTGAFPW